MYDAIIIGARCAGSPLAMRLAQKGYRVLAVDRDTFPSDTLSTAFLQPDAVERLRTWGLYDKLLATGCPEVPLKAVFGGFEMPPQPFVTTAPRRTYLDKILVDAAREAGTEVREGYSVLELLRDGDGSVTGIRGRGRDGVSASEEARVIIGADGRNSIVARTVEAEEYDTHEPTTVAYYSFFSGAEIAEHELHYNGRHALFAFPTNDGLICLAVEAPYERREEVRADPEGYLRRAMAEHAPDLGARMAGAKREETMYGMLGRRSLYRKPFGPGWVLVGDAGFLKDPVTGRGVDDAFRDAEQVAGALDGWLCGRETFEEAMAAFQRQRDEATRDAYQQTCFLAQMHEVTPEFLQVMAGAQAAAGG